MKINNKLCDICKQGHNGLKCIALSCICELCNKGKELEYRKKQYRDNKILGFNK